MLILYIKHSNCRGCKLRQNLFIILTVWRLLNDQRNTLTSKVEIYPKVIYATIHWFMNL